MSKAKAKTEKQVEPSAPAPAVRKRQRGRAILCPQCGADMFVVRSYQMRTHPPHLDRMRQYLRCSACGHRASRTV